MKRTDVTNSARLAGRVTRYHTHPTIQQQTVADHTFHVLRIYTELYGPPPAHVTYHILIHDLDEVALGDVPFPVKRDNPELSQIYKRKGEEVIKDLFKDARIYKSEVDDLDSQERFRVKACDLLEMLEFGVEEKLLGNQYASIIIDDITDSLSSLFDGSATIEIEMKMRKIKDRLKWITSHT